ncbi:MAG: DUF58 domain-containing protein [Dactylosporangium sp.]|nr:DUF58 domain-containing protein [Dactylosporangium sp.]NNJ59411.1 DUF58 domain-containing protein [Dactylosporangium sp.]
MRNALRGLTTRGRCFLAAAGAAALAALLLGEKDLLRVAVLLAALPLMAAWYVGRTRYRLACVRSLEPRRVPVGVSARVVLRLTNLSWIPTGTMLLEDRLPYALGSKPRLVLERLEAQRSSSVGYTVLADLRGRYTAGPLVVRLTDPFGLCEMIRSFPSVDRLTVIPRVLALPSIPLTGEYGGSGDSRSRAAAVHGEDDAAPREYREGDDLRRVHWRSTARVGELMVRREEQPWEALATVALDTRTLAHRGEGPASSFEWAVTAAASIAVHLRRDRYRLRLVTACGVDADARPELGGEGLVLDHLAEVRLTRRATVTGLVDLTRKRSRAGLVVGVFGTLTPPEAAQLAALRSSGTTYIAFLLNTTSWLGLTGTERQEAEAAHAATALALVRGGWRVVPVSHGAKLPEVWPQATRGSQGFTWRAAMAETVAGVGR